MGRREEEARGSRDKAAIGAKGSAELEDRTRPLWDGERGGSQEDTYTSGSSSA